MSTAERDAVMRSARADPESVLVAARRIHDPWFRCQALAAVARWSPPGGCESIAAEALTAAGELQDPYRRVAVSAWPVRALIENGQVGGVPRLLNELRATAGGIEHPVSRLEALSLLWQAAFPLEDRATDLLLDAFAAACAAANSWKAGSRLEDAVLILAARDRPRAQSLATAMPESKSRSRALQRLSEGQVAAPRPFFW